MMRVAVFSRTCVYVAASGDTSSVCLVVRSGHTSLPHTHPAPHPSQKEMVVDFAVELIAVQLSTQPVAYVQMPPMATHIVCSLPQNCCSKGGTLIGLCGGLGWNNNCVPVCFIITIKWARWERERERKSGRLADILLVGSF